MFVHYLKIALRNIRKFALQNTVSVIGLAAGFVCLCLSSVWLYYENSFDTFHKDDDRIYTLRASSELMANGEYPVSETGNKAIHSFAESIDAEQTTYFRYETVDDRYTELKVDSVFCDFFGIELLKGDWSFIGNGGCVAISEHYAKKVFLDMDPLGQKIDGREVVAVLKDFKGPSVLKFDVLSYREVVLEIPTEQMSAFYVYTNMTKILQSSYFFKLKEGVDPEDAVNMLKNGTDEVTASNMALLNVTKSEIELMPIKDVHLYKIKETSYVSYRTMSMFFLASILIMLCSLVNILIFFINTLKGRDREAALRVVHGASVKDLVKMFSLEMSILVIAGLVLGLIMVWMLKKPYISLVDISMPQGYLLICSALLMVIVFLISALVCIICVSVIGHRTIQTNISGSRRSGLFRKLSVGLQLFTGTLFAFITCVMLHQFNYLRNENWGLRVNDQAVVTLSPAQAMSIMDIFTGNFNSSSEEEFRALIEKQDEYSNTDYQQKYESQYGITEKIQSLPSVTQVISGLGDFYAASQAGQYNLMQGLGINDIDSCEYGLLEMLDEKGLSMLNVTVLDGAIPTDRPITDNEVVITENLSRKLGLGPVSDDPVISVERRVANSIMEYLHPTIEKNDFHVIAVIKDMHTLNYQSESPQIIMCTPGNPRIALNLGDLSILSTKPRAIYLVRYEHGMKKELVHQLENAFDGMDFNYEISFTEDQYYKQLEKEKHLKNLILVLGVICLVISIFGVWSMINLACQERRREIAVRKVHGAKIKDILSIFTKEYGLVVVSSMALAFITGYLIMHQWMQRFTNQAAISWWIYAGIFCATVVVIGLTVIHKVLKTASENPAEVIKSE